MNRLIALLLSLLIPLSVFAQTSNPGVLSIRKDGSPKIMGNVTLSEGANISLTQVGKDIEIASIGSSGISIGDPIGSGTSRSVLYVDAAGDLAQDNAAFSWNDSTNRLGIGTSNPTTGQIHVTEVSNDARLTNIYLANTGAGIGTGASIEANWGQYIYFPYQTTGTTPASQPIILQTGAGGAGSRYTLADTGKMYISGSAPGIVFPTNAAAVTFSQELGFGSYDFKTGGNLTFTTYDNTLGFTERMKLYGSGTSLGVVWNENGIASSDFRIEGDTDANLFSLDASSDRIGFGILVPAAKTHTIATTEQQRLGYDASNYLSTTVASNGATTIDATGAGAAIILPDTINLSSLSASLPLKLDGSKNILAQAIALGGSEVSGTLGAGNGGTGLTALGTANQLFGTNNAANANEYKAVTATAAGALTAAGAITSTAGAITATSGNVVITSGNITMGTAASQLIPGATSFSIRNNASSQDNLLVSNAGAVTTAAGITATTGNIVSSAGNLTATAGNLTFGAASASIIPGATSLLFRDNANSNTNLSITNAGLVTVRAGLTLTANPLTFSAAASQIVPGATSLSLRNNANNADNLILTDAGAATIRAGATITANNLTFGGATAGIVPGATSFTVRNNANSADNLLISNAGALTARTSMTATSGAITATSGNFVAASGYLVFNTTDQGITSDTVDGTDNQKVIIQGAGDSGTYYLGTRGAALELNGNEAASAGAWFLYSGTTATVNVFRAMGTSSWSFRDSTNANNLSISSAGVMTFPNLTASTPLKLNASKEVISSDIDLTTDVTGVLPTANGGSLSGTHTPTLTNTTNVSSSTAFSGQYERVGNTVTFSFTLDIDPTTASTATEVQATLPVASNFANFNEAAGVVSSNAVFGYVGAVMADTTTDRIRIRFISDAGAASQNFNVIVTYRVI